MFPTNQVNIKNINFFMLFQILKMLHLRKSMLCNDYLIVYSVCNKLAYVMISLISVVEICTDETKMQDATNSVLIKADDKQNCRCDLQVENQNQDVKVYIRKYAQEASSSPSELGCGLILRFEIKDNNWDAQCEIDNNRISMIIKLNTVMTIKSESVNGTLQPNEGYCIEIKKGTFY